MDNVADFGYVCHSRICSLLLLYLATLSLTHICFNSVYNTDYIFIFASNSHNEMLFSDEEKF